MSYIYLLLHRLHLYYTKNRTIFFLFVLGVAVNSALFAYVYGNARPIMARYNRTDGFYRLYRVFFDYEISSSGGVSVNPTGVDHITDTDIRNLQDTGLFESVSVCSLYSLYELDSATISASVFGDPYISHDKGADSPGRGQVLVSSDSNLPVEIGMELPLRGQNYIVAGRYVGDVLYQYIVDYDTYKENGLDTNVLILLSKDRWHYDNDVPCLTLQKMFPDAAVRPSFYERYDERDSELIMPIIKIVFFISFVTFAFLLSYLSEQIADENIVSLIVGANRTTLYCMIISEGLVMAVASEMLGLIGHFLLYDIVFDKLNITTGIVYHYSDYLNILLIMTAGTFIITSIYALKYCWLTPVQNKNKIG